MRGHVPAWYTSSYMNNHLIGTQRGIPLHAPVTTTQNGENTLETSPMQQGAAARVELQPPTAATAEDYVISVEQVREHFKSKGLSKSKDTVQRWCRTSDLDCQKRGVLGRYFTTEASLQALENKLLPDMIAENAGAVAAASTGIEPHVDAGSENVHARTAASSEELASEQQHAAADTPERNSMQGDAPKDAAAHTDPQLAELKAQVVGLTSQLEQAQEMNQFLREEIVSARGQRGDVVKIAEQMLGTLETIAVGGRLERPNQENGRDPVRYQQVNDDARAV